MDRIQLRRDTAARWAEINPVLLEGEVGFETDTRLRKIGDGVSRWNELDYLKAEGIVNDLTTGGADKALSAEMGKELNVELNVLSLLSDSVKGDLVEKDYITYPCLKGVAINTTTINAGAKRIDVTSKATLFIRLTDPHKCLDAPLTVIVKNSDLSANISTLPLDGDAAISLDEGTYYICAYVSPQNVIGRGDIFVYYGIVLDSNTSIKGNVESLEKKVEPIIPLVPEHENKLLGYDKIMPIDSVDITYPCSKGVPINTTTINAGAKEVNIAVGNVIILTLSDVHGCINGDVTIMLKNSSLGNISTCSLASNSSVEVKATADIKYISAYVSGGNVVGNGEVKLSCVSYSNNKEFTIFNKVYEIENSINRPFTRSKGLFIGASIVTGDNYFWKGFLERIHGISYIRDISSNSQATTDSELNPAYGGTVTVPYVTEPNLNKDKSIWYRCANNRMAIYKDFDFICLSTGFNDMNYAAFPDMVLGTVDDVPYVDSLEGFSSEKAATLTATRPQELTYASSLMGCIEMLHRDFPTARIIIPTVQVCTGTYGTQDVDGMKMSERLAILQMQIANKYSYNGLNAPLCAYNVIGIAWYWDWRNETTAKAGILTKDGVHPNHASAYRMASIFASTLGEG